MKMKRKKSSPSAKKQYYSNYIAHYTKKNLVILLLAGLFLVGVLLGTLLVRVSGDETVSLLLRMVEGFTQARSEQFFWQNFISSLTSSVLILAFVFICGFCAIAQPIELSIPFFRGLGFGFSSAALYASYKTQAVGYIASFILPGMIISTIAIVFFCKESIKLSNNIWSTLRKGEYKDEYSLRIYFARFVVTLILCAVSAFVEAFVIGLFGGSVLL